MSRRESYTFVVDGDEVAAKRWNNPDGSVGGWVAATAKIDSSATIEFDAVVEPKAVVGPNVRVKSGTVIGFDCHL
jgi:UDP-3-O-[3-hydroxymyristoyl] glucosamine N-acyltransferase